MNKFKFFFAIVVTKFVKQKKFFFFENKLSIVSISIHFVVYIRFVKCFFFFVEHRNYFLQKLILFIY